MPTCTPQPTRGGALAAVTMANYEDEASDSRIQAAQLGGVATSESSASPFRAAFPERRKNSGEARSSYSLAAERREPTSFAP